MQESTVALNRLWEYKDGKIQALRQLHWMQLHSISNVEVENRIKVLKDTPPTRIIYFSMAVKCTDGVSIELQT